MWIVCFDVYPFNTRKEVVYMDIFNEATIREHIHIDVDVIREIEAGFTALYEGKAVMPPIMRIDIPENNGEVDSKSAYIRGEDSFALKISSGFFDNDKLGLPSTGGLMFLISAVHGQPVAVLHDNGYLTDVRTAAAGAVAADYLANEEIETVGVIGSGVQARYQLEALSKVRSFNNVIAYSRTRENVEQYCEDVSRMYEIEAIAADDAEQVANKSDLIITTTQSSEPVLQKEWINPGTHITAMGSDAPHKQELDEGIIQLADIVVCDYIEQCEECGELRRALEKKLVDKNSVLELGQLTKHKRKPRTSKNDITVADLTGTGVQDTKIALLAYNRLAETVG